MVEVCIITFSELRIFKDLNSSQLSWVCGNSRNVAVCCEWERIPEKDKPLEEWGSVQIAARLFQIRPHRSWALEKED